MTRGRYTVLAYRHDHDPARDESCTGCGPGADCHYSYWFRSREDAERFAAERTCYGREATVTDFGD